MNGAAGTALEWALALLHAPAERHRLRQKPLPPGVGEVLAIAANVAPDELDGAATRLRETPANVLEAARFYAREILFHADADAYRTLGVTDEATTDQIKAHFRWLQIWLHPDRQQSGDDSVFAARVNQAWNQLRSDDRRRAYDLERSGARGLEERLRPRAPESADTRPITPGSWHPVPAGTPVVGRKRHRVLVVALLGVCAVLGWLVVRQSERAPEPWRFDAAKPAETEAPAAPIASESPPAFAAQPSKPVKHESRMSDAAPTSSAVTVEHGEPTARPAVDVVVAPRHSPERSPETRVAIAPDVRKPGKAERNVPTEPARVASNRNATAVSPTRAPVAAAATQTSTRTVARNPEPVASAAESVRPIADTGTAQAARQDVDQRASDPSLLDRLRRAFTRRQPQAESADLGVSGDVDYERIQQVRQVGSRLLQYLASESATPPPIWSSASTINRADGLRHDMHRDGVARLSAPRWRIGKTSASFESDYSVAGRNRGTLSVAVVWRDNRWLVSSINLDANP